MQAVVEWFVKDRVIFQRPQPVLTIDSVKVNNATLIDLLDQGKPLVHVIVDARYIEKLPTNLFELRGATSFVTHPSIGWVITVTNSALIKFFGGMLPQIGAKTRYRVFGTLEEAFAFLEELDTTIDWSTRNTALLTVK